MPARERIKDNGTSRGKKSEPTVAPGEAASESTRDRIVEATSRHLAELGPRELELRAVCKELDITPSLVNYYFEDPQELLWTAAIAEYRAHVAAQRQAFERAPDGKSAVEGWVLKTIEWRQEKPGVAAIIDYPMLALSGATSEEELSKEMSSISRENVTITGSAVYALMTGKTPRMLSTTRVAALIRLNGEFAYWISAVGFGGTGAGTWIAGRKPYSRVWRAFGFSPDRQIRATLREMTARLGSEDPPRLSGDDE